MLTINDIELNSLILRFNLNLIDHSGKPFFKQEKEKKYFCELLLSLKKEYDEFICGPKEQFVFRLFREISLDKLKVVILGQDPYHTPKVADGLAFSTGRDNYFPPSLRNIFLELSRDIACNFPETGDLLPGVKQGVFLLNTCLSVRDNEPLSHSFLGKNFIYSLINYLNQSNDKIVGVFGGKKAQKIKEDCSIDTSRSITSAHPSPYSVNHGFFYSRPFTKINSLLLRLNLEIIDGKL